MSTLNLTIDPFNGINLTLPATVTLTEGAEQSVTATGDSDVLALLSTDVDSNGVWNIGLQRPVFHSYSLEIAITVPRMVSISLNGSGTINVDDFTNQGGDLSINMNGNGTINLNSFDCNSLTVNTEGSGHFNGLKDFSVPNLNITHGGSAIYDAFPISGNDCKVTSTGSGDCKLTATINLNVNIKGSGDVLYKGNPAIKLSDSGSGKLTPAN